MFFRTIAGLALAVFLSLPVFGAETTIVIEDAFARGGPRSGAAFFTIRNDGEQDDRLLFVETDVAGRAELHTHSEDENGVVRMRPVGDGAITVPAGGTHALQRGGDHVMLMDLDAPLEQGARISVTLHFETAGEVSVEIPVDNDR